MFGRLSSKELPVNLKLSTTYYYAAGLSDKSIAMFATFLF